MLSALPSTGTPAAVPMAVPTARAASSATFLGISFCEEIKVQGLGFRALGEGVEGREGKEAKGLLCSLLWVLHYALATGCGVHAPGCERSGALGAAGATLRGCEQ